MSIDTGRDVLVQLFLTSVISVHSCLKKQVLCVNMREVLRSVENMFSGGKYCMY